MIRRSFLQALGAVGAVGGFEAATNPATRFYTIENVFMKNGDQTGRLSDFLANGFLPAARKVHAGPILMLDAIIAAHLPQSAIVLGFPSGADALSLYSRLHGQAGYAEAVGKWEGAPNAPYESTSSSLLEATEYSPEIHTVERPASPRIFELRTYHSPTWTQLAALHERFAGPEVRIFQRSGIHPLFYTSTVFGSNLPNLTYLIPFDSLAAREKAWAVFSADPEWIKVRRESVEKHGEIASIIQISLFKAAPYSPVQ